MKGSWKKEETKEPNPALQVEGKLERIGIWHISCNYCAPSRAQNSLLPQHKPHKQDRLALTSVSVFELYAGITGKKRGQNRLYDLIWAIPVLPLKKEDANWFPRFTPI